MLTRLISNIVVLVAVYSYTVVNASPAPQMVESEPIVIPSATRQAAPVVPTVPALVENLVVNSNTSFINANVTRPAVVLEDTASAYSGFSGLNGYAIPYQVLVVPQSGVTLPVLNNTATSGNYGAIVIISEVSYNYGAPSGFQSALTPAQFATLYQYQVSFGVRMVRLDVFPSADSGTTALGGCCDTGVEQLVSFSSTTAFPTAGLKTGAGVSTRDLWHYPAAITDSSIATEFAQFAPTEGFSTTSTAGVINNIGGRQQMVFFLGFANDWASTSNYLQHAWIHWVTRGLYTGYRRITFGTQVDDMFLISDIYSPAGSTYQITTADLDQHVSWMGTINAKLPAGSDYFIEIAHNGNGNIEDAAETEAGETACGFGPIEYDEQIDTPLEFIKPLGTGTNLWPPAPATYPYSTTCTNLADLKRWWATPDNRDAFAHVSHTFTHEDENNATYFDVYREITWNQDWLAQIGIAAANTFSPNGIVPPAITGLHNGDALRAWDENGIVNAVGDNTRPALLNTHNEHWPLITTVEANGYAGIQITPRWATNIYYNCDLPACTVLEWINTSAGNGDWNALLALEKNTNTRHLLGLHREPFMFHQANLNYLTAPTTTINGVSAKYSLLQAWVETILQEMVRLTNWPVITLKHDDIAAAFMDRMNRDECSPSLSWNTDPVAKTITGVTVTTNDNECSVTIPVTVPGAVTNTQGFTTEKIGADPLTIWVEMSGSPVSLTLSTPIPF